MQVAISHTEKLFNLADARAMLPLLKSITLRHQQQLTPVQDRLNKMLSNDPRRNSIEFNYEQIVACWKAKMEKLGVGVYGLWVIGFDVGEGVLCWKFPELDVKYFRCHGQGFSSRVKLDDFIEEQDPDWAKS